MGKIINLSQAKNLKTNSKTVVLAGGCFDILHQGHLKYLQTAKKQGDILMVALESDKSVNRLKGKNRPVNNEKTRANNLLKTNFVDYVIILPDLKTVDDYLKMVQTISPDIIAVTAGDPQIENKQKQAEIIGAKVIEVIDRIPGHSTTDIVKQKNIRY